MKIYSQARKKIKIFKKYLKFFFLELKDQTLPLMMRKKKKWIIKKRKTYGKIFNDDQKKKEKFVFHFSCVFIRREEKILCNYYLDDS